MRVGPKFDAFIDHEASVEFLEGVTAAGKTTVGIYKYMIKVAESPKTLHIIAGLDLGTTEKNIIDRDHGILDEWGCLTEYNGNGTKDLKMPHLLFHVAPGVDKKILILGYDDRKRWKKALGGQYGCLYIDEINIADMDFVREASMRCDYLIGTLNPDDPFLPIYKEYVNHSRPLPEWMGGTPQEILSDLIEEPKPGWTHWFFNFEDNIALTPEKIAQIKQNVPQGTKLWKNKILGIRGRATGLVFSNFNRHRHVVTKAWAKQFLEKSTDGQLSRGELERLERFRYFSAAVDTAYSQQSPDTIAFAFLGITNKGRCVVLDERVYNNATLLVPIAPSDTVRNLIEFLERNRKEWGLARDVFIDSADQATITECIKYKRIYGSVYNFGPAWKKEKIIDRINAQLGWFAEGETGPCFFIVDTCQTYIHEIEVYSWMEDKDNTPEDGNDHMINAVQYGWLPYEARIGIGRRKPQ